LLVLFFEQSKLEFFNLSWFVFPTATINRSAFSFVRTVETAE